MALPMLVSGADCGPSNPLQGLSKRFDQDRGLKQDYIHSNARAESASQSQFRTRLASPSAVDQDTARFFSSGSQVIHDPAFDVSALRLALPYDTQGSSHTSQMQQPNLSAGWASDFVNQQPIQVPAQLSAKGSVGTTINSGNVNVQHSIGPVGPRQGPNMRWYPGFQGNAISQLSGIPVSPLTRVAPPAMNATDISWDKEFGALEQGPSASIIEYNDEAEQRPQQNPHQRNELAVMAGLLLENVKDESNPKFRKSQFMGLMRQLRDGEVIVEGNQMVENHGWSTANDTASQVDVKGKGRATEIFHNDFGRSTRFHSISRTGFRDLENSAVPQKNSSEEQSLLEDANDIYFRQENAEYTRYWTGVDVNTPSAHTTNLDVASWDKLQNDWDKFEATASGIRPVESYQFQDNNPYLIGDSSKTRHHAMHSHQSIVESVLELEAAVQRDVNSVSAWLALGVKQQENEREQKAVQALRRAIELDPSHLPAWLALAVSFTNDNDRLGTYGAIHEWVNRNDKYKDFVVQFRNQNPDKPTASIQERYAYLTQCLIAMTRSDGGDEIDADIQVALAVLLNANEDYAKARDCFRTALALRPEDWLLYNRVGATLANSGQAEDAIQYYYRALELNPGYIRARFNLGISCINLKRYEEAAQYILDALVLQDNDGVRDIGGLNQKRGITSDVLWDSLKTTCVHMQRVDLATLCDKQDLQAFRSAFQP